jgi:hypothetical protein
MATEVELFDSTPHYDWHRALLQCQTISRISEEGGKEIRDYQASLAGYDSLIGQSEVPSVEASLKAIAKVASRVIAQDQ